MIHVRRLLVLTLALAGCGKASPPSSATTPVTASPVTTSTPESAQPAVSSSTIANPAESVVRNPEQEPPEAATHEFGSGTAKAHPEQAKAMLANAQRTWEATTASYDVGTTTLESVHRWSKEFLLAERALAETKEQDLAALVDYWKRTKLVYLKVRALNSTGTRGGEAPQFGAASFYLAEAELWLLDAGGTIPDEIDE